MSSYNKVLLMGNLTRDIELKYIPSGQPVAKLALATNRRYKSGDGEMKEETTFVDCEAWGRTAEVMNQYLAKGRPVFIEGRLKLDQWQDQSGQNRSKLKVVVEKFEFIDSRGGGGSGGGGGGSGSSRDESNMATTPTGSGGGGGDHAPISEDDIPF